MGGNQAGFVFCGIAALQSVKDDTEEIKGIVKETKDMMQSMKSGKF